MARTIAGIFAVLWLSGCGPSSSGGPTDLSATGKQRLADYCTKRDACGVEIGNPPGSEICPTSMCLASLSEEAPLLDYFDCQIAKQCTAFFNDDDCVVSAGTSDAERDAFLARCQAKATSCASEGFAAFCVVGYPLFRKQWMHAVDACLTRDCADVPACVQAIGIKDCWHSGD